MIMLPAKTHNRLRTCSIRVWKSAAAFCLFACFIVSDLAYAQDDSLTVVDALAGVKVLDETEQLILKTVQDSNPKTAPELANAIKILLDIDLFDEAKAYITQIDALGLDDQKLFELNQSAGADFFLLIHTQKQLQPEGKALAMKVLTASKTVGNSTARIQQLIKVLNNQDITVRSAAFRQLRQIGEPAVAEMLNTFADPDRKSLYPGLRGGLKFMGVNAQGPLLGAAHAADSQVQAEAIRALGNYNSLEARHALMRAYLSNKVPSYLRRIALDSLSGSGSSLVDAAEVEKQLFDASMDYLTGNRKYSGAMLGTVQLWNWDSESKSLVPTEVSPETAARMIASRRAEDLYEIRPDLPRNRELYLLTQLEVAKRMAGQNKQVKTDKLVQRLSLNQSEVDSLLVRAMELELIPAAIACCEVLGAIGDDSTLFQSETPSSMVQAILFGDRHLQFAALEAIAKLDPQQAFPGSSYVVSLAVYLAKSKNRPAGLIGHNDQTKGQTFAANLADSGLVGEAVMTSKEFFDASIENPDIEVLFVTDTLDRPDSVELIQQLRNDWRTRRLPIAFLYRDLERGKRVILRVRDNKRFAAIPFSLQPDLIASNVNRLSELDSSWKVTNFDRRRHAAAAVKWLEKVSIDTIAYGFYNLGNQQNSLISLLYVPGFASSSSKILASLGTPTAQRELVNFASQSGLPIEDRQKVASAFSECVKRGGTLLTTREIQQQYDRYNASEKESTESQKVLGVILDAIEARKRAAVGSAKK